MNKINESTTCDALIGCKVQAKEKKNKANTINNKVARKHTLLGNILINA